MSPLARLADDPQPAVAVEQMGMGEVDDQAGPGMIVIARMAGNPGDQVFPGDLAMQQRIRAELLRDIDIQLDLCGLSLTADRIVRGAVVYKTLIIWPYAVAPAIAGALWGFIFLPGPGVLAYFLNRLGLDWNYVLNGWQAMTVVVLAAAWKQISYNFLFFLAGLQAIPKSMIEAAAIDGASPVRRFWTIIFPLLSPTLFFLIVVNITYAFFETFGVIHATTRGGPFKATEILVYKVWYDGFEAQDLGGSAAQSVILMIIVITLTVMQFRYIERRVHY